MRKRQPAGAPDPGQALVESYLVNDRMNQLLIEQLDPRAWRGTPPGDRVRSIAAIFSHVHNIRRKWLRLSAPHLDLPAPLDRSRATPEETRSALGESAARCAEMIGQALLARHGSDAHRVETFLRDAWAKPWTAGGAMVAYMIAHEAHHRGQVCMLAHQLGFPLSPAGGSQLWAWERLWKECGFTRPG